MRGHLNLLKFELLSLIKGGKKVDYCSECCIRNLIGWNTMVDNNLLRKKILSNEIVCLSLGIRKTKKQNWNPH